MPCWARSPTHTVKAIADGVVACALVLVLLALTSRAGYAATFTGTVFEDVNYGGGAGRSLASASGVGLANVRVELYRVSTGALIDSDTTDAAGAYSLSSGGGVNGALPHIVRVVNGTVHSSRTGGSGCSTCVPVQTFRTDASSGTAVAVTNRVGGESPLLSDAPSNTTNANYSTLNTASQAAQSITTAAPASNGSTIANINFGFNFDTIVSTDDTASCAPTSGGTFFPCQGNMRQFIINANALGGEGSLNQSGSGLIDGTTTSLPSGNESSIFMIPSAQLSGGVAVITLSTTLPTVTGNNTRLDATTQTINIGNSNPGTLGTGGTVGVDAIPLPLFQRPEVQIDAGNTQITLSGSSDSINGFALRQGYILLNGTSNIARNNLVGMTASGSSSDNSPSFYGITYVGANAVIRSNFVTVNNSGIRGDSAGAGAVISSNEVARPSSGHTNTFDGILLIGNVTSATVQNNLARDQVGGGIEIGFTGGTASNVTVTNNTVTNNGFGSTEPVGFAAYSFTGSNVVISKNRIQSNAGAGALVMSANGVIFSQNSFSSNGSISIDLDPRGLDPNTMGTVQGVTLNDSGDADTGPNGLLNYPVITSATLLGGQLQLAGYARPGTQIELYIAQPDATGFGEGLTYLTTLTEGSASDFDATTGTYGPAAINGVAQGTDNTNRFLFRISPPAGVAIGTVLSGTGTLGGQTSEFSGNVTVTSGPTLVHAKTLQVLSDPVNNTTNPKSIPGAVETYTIRITNQGAGATDSNSVDIIDAVPMNTELFVRDLGASGSGPVAFANGTPVSGLTWTFTALGSTTDDVDFSNNGGTSWTYTPTPDAAGYDSAVTHIRLRPKGAMNGATVSGNPYFDLSFRVRVK